MNALYPYIEGRVRNIQTAANAPSVWVARSEPDREARMVYALPADGEWLHADVVIIDQNNNFRLDSDDYYFKFRNGSWLEVTDAGIQPAEGLVGLAHTVMNTANDAIERTQRGSVSRYGELTPDEVRRYFSGARDWVLVEEDGTERRLDNPLDTPE